MGAVSPGGAWSSQLITLRLWLLRQPVSEADSSGTRLVVEGAVISIWPPQVGEGEMSLCISGMSPAFQSPLFTSSQAESANSILGKYVPVAFPVSQTA